MIPVKQSTMGGLEKPLGERGDCLSAAFASILELPLESVPRFCDLETLDWGPHIDRWLSWYNFSYVELLLSEYVETCIRPSLGWHVVTGMSPRNSRHAVVAFGSDLIHDPHPTVLGDPILLPHVVADDDLCWTVGLLVARYPELAKGVA